MLQCWLCESLAVLAAGFGRRPGIFAVLDFDARTFGGGFLAEAMRGKRTELEKLRGVSDLPVFLEVADSD